MKWQEKRPMSPQEYINSLKTLGFNHVSAGRFFDYSERTSQRYAKGTAEVPRTLVMLIRVLLLFGIKIPRQ
jgi:hypothetical protein